MFGTPPRATTIVYGARARPVRDGGAKQKDGYDQNNVATPTNST